MTIQGNYSINPEVGFAGFIADPQRADLHSAGAVGT